MEHVRNKAVNAKIKTATMKSERHTSADIRTQGYQSDFSRPLQFGCGYFDSRPPHPKRDFFKTSEVFVVNLFFAREEIRPPKMVYPPLWRVMGGKEGSGSPKKNEDESATTLTRTVTCGRSKRMLPTFSRNLRSLNASTTPWSSSEYLHIT